jgi:cyanophycin synthetase
LDIVKLTETALKMKPGYIVASELTCYLRGRAPGEIPGLIAQTARAHGMDEKQIYFADSAFLGAKHIVEQLQSDDLALLMVLSDREQVVELLKEAQ